MLVCNYRSQSQSLERKKRLVPLANQQRDSSTSPNPSLFLLTSHPCSLLPARRRGDEREKGAAGLPRQLRTPPHWAERVSPAEHVPALAVHTRTPLVRKVPVRRVSLCVAVVCLKSRGRVCLLVCLSHFMCACFWFVSLCVIGFNVHASVSIKGLYSVSQCRCLVAVRVGLSHSMCVFDFYISGVHTLSHSMCHY